MNRTELILLVLVGAVGVWYFTRPASASTVVVATPSQQAGGAAPAVSSSPSDFAHAADAFGALFGAVAAIASTTPSNT